jgi:hypothetical protein
MFEATLTQGVETLIGGMREDKRERVEGTTGLEAAVSRNANGGRRGWTGKDLKRILLYIYVHRWVTTCPEREDEWVSPCGQTARSYFMPTTRGQGEMCCNNTDTCVPPR